MKTAEVKTANSARNHIQAKRQPFFSKEGQDSFFSRTSNTVTSFFSPATIQSKLTIGQPNDKYEVEADAMADKVVQRLNSPFEGGKGDVSQANNSVGIQAKCSHSEEKLQKKEGDEVLENDVELQRKPIFESNSEKPDTDIQTKPLSPPLIQAKCSSCDEEEKLQKKEEDEVSETDVEVQEKPIFESNGAQPEAELQTKPIQSVDAFSDVDAATSETVANGSETVQTKSILNHSPVVIATKTIEPQEQLQENEEEYSDSKEEIQTKLSAVDNSQPPDEEESIQTKSEGSPSDASSTLQSRLNSSKGSGSQLSSDMQNSMSNEFGTDFSNVRVHTDSSAVHMSKELGAQAFTHGNDIYFNEGKYDTSSDTGQHLLAHELTHTIQQVSNQRTIQTQLLTPLGQSDGFPGVVEREQRRNFPADSSTSGGEVTEEELIEQMESETSGGEVSEAEIREQELREELGMTNCPSRIFGSLGDFILSVGDYQIHDGGNYSKLLDTELVDFTLVPFYTPFGLGLEIDGEVNGFIQGSASFGPITLKDILVGIDYGMRDWDDIIADLENSSNFSRTIGDIIRYLFSGLGGVPLTFYEMTQLFYSIDDVKAKANLHIPASINLSMGLDARLEVAPAILGIDLDELASLSFGLRALMGVSANAELGGEIDIRKSGDNYKFCHAKGLDLNLLLDFGLNGFLRGTFLWFESEIDTDLVSSSWGTDISFGSRIGIIYDGGFQTANSGEGNDSDGIFIDLPGVAETVSRIGEFVSEMLEASGMKDEVAHEVDEDVDSNTSEGGSGCDQPNVNSGDIVCLQDRPADFAVGEIVDSFLINNVWFIRYRPHQMGGTSSIPAYRLDCSPVFRIVSSENECFDSPEELERDPCIPDSSFFTPLLNNYTLRSRLRDARRDLLRSPRIHPVSSRRAYSWNRNVAIAQLRISYRGRSDRTIASRPFMNEARGGRHSEDRILSEMYHISESDPEISSIEMIKLVSERQECQAGNRITGRPSCQDLLNTRSHPPSLTGARIITHNRTSYFIAPFSDGYDNRQLRRAYCLETNSN